MGHGTWDGTWDMDMGLPWYGTQIATGCKLRSSITHPNPEPRTVKTQPTPAQTTKHPPHHPCCESSLVAFAVRVQCPPLGKPWFNLELKANHRWAPNLLKSVACSRLASTLLKYVGSAQRRPPPPPGLRSVGGPKLLKWGLSGRGSNLLSPGTPYVYYLLYPCGGKQTSFARRVCAAARLSTMPRPTL